MGQRLLWTRMFSLAVLVVLAFGTGAAGQTGMDRLVGAAKQEGQLTVIALPPDWCGYGDVIEAFKQKYRLKVNQLNTNARSGDEIEANKADKGKTGAPP